MRERWPRFRPEIELEPDALAHLIQRALPGASVVGYRAIGGGRANTNVRVDLVGPPGAVMLRIYQRDPSQAHKEARLDQLLRAACVPTAGFMGLIEADARTGLTCAVLEWIPGARLDVQVPGAQDQHLGREVGKVLAAVHNIAVGPAGFLSPDSRPLSAITLGHDAMRAYIHARIVEGPGAERLGPALTRRLLAFINREAGRLAAWAETPGLVHGDCNASNFMICDGRVAALLDWEFAFSGAGAFDFGNLLRPAVGDSAAFIAGLGEGYRRAGGVLPTDWRRLAEITDLYAWADFLGRDIIAPELVEDARLMVARTLDAVAE